MIVARSHDEPQTVMLASANRCDPTDRVRSGAHTAITLARYGTAWPIFLARETLAAWDDGLAFMMNVILGDEWQTVGLDEARRSRRRAG